MAPTRRIKTRKKNLDVGNHTAYKPRRPMGHLE